MNKHINVSIAEAKNRLSKIINEVVFAKKRVILNSHGQPKAAMISGCKSRLLFAKIAMAIWCQEAGGRCQVQAPLFIIPDT